MAGAGLRALVRSIFVHVWVAGEVTDIRKAVHTGPVSTLLQDTSRPSRLTKTPMQIPVDARSQNYRRAINLGKTEIGARGR